MKRFLTSLLLAGACTLGMSALSVDQVTGIWASDAVPVRYHSNIDVSMEYTYSLYAGAAGLVVMYTLQWEQDGYDAKALVMGVNSCSYSLSDDALTLTGKGPWRIDCGIENIELTGSGRGSRQNALLKAAALAETFASAIEFPQAIRFDSINLTTAADGSNSFSSCTGDQNLIFRRHTY